MKTKKKRKLEDWELDSNKVLFNWMKKNYGTRCKDFEKGCACCVAWKLYDRLIQKRSLIEK